MKRNIAYILGVMLLAASCISEQGLDVNSTRKDEVKFAAEMKNAVTKTLYGADNASSIKVKWVNGDQIKVFGTNCAVSTGEYQITEAANKPNVDGSNEESIADALVRMGEVGVQWGSEKKSDFVAVYPAENASFQYNSNTGVVTATTTISSTQNYVFNDAVATKTDKNGNSIKVWEGTHFANDATNPSMQNAIMYARTDEVSAGSNVALSFEPYSTVLKFRFEGFESLWSVDAEAYVQSIVITAPQGDYIAGDFDITIPRNKDVSSTNPVKATSKGTGSNSITINTIKAGGSFLKVKANEAVEFNVFTVPLSGLTMVEANPWTVTINVQGMDPLVYKMLPSKDGGYTLVPGLIHKVKVPKMVSNKVPEWNPENWITQIPPPVYLSELSVPGAWYATDENYQGEIGLQKDDNKDGIDDGLASLYKAGIRAFHIDCRLSYDKVTKPAGSTNHTFSETMTLVCAGTEKAESTLGYITSLDYEQGVPVKTHIEDLLELVREDEYIVIVLTIAETPKAINYGVGRQEFGTIAPEVCLAEISAVIEQLRGTHKAKDGSPVIYSNMITEDTIVDDVLGHAIIKVNVNTTADKFTNYSVVPNTLISMGSLAAEGEYMTGDVVGTNVLPNMFKESQHVPLYWGKTSVNMTYHYHHAQRTLQNNTTALEGIPYYRDRITAVDDIISISKGVYDASHHNAWFQIGIGGTRKNNTLNASSSQLEVGEQLNPYLYGRIVSKMDTDPSPVGIVLMNHATRTATSSATVDGVSYTASSQDLVKAIIEMNGKFYLNRQGNDVITGDGTQTQELETKAAAYVGPDAF